MTPAEDAYRTNVEQLPEMKKWLQKRIAEPGGTE
jgi:hypothetical protein